MKEIDEELKGGQKKLDVAEPKGKITAADFKALRAKKGMKKEAAPIKQDIYGEDPNLDVYADKDIPGQGKDMKEKIMKYQWHTIALSLLSKVQWNLR